MGLIIRYINGPWLQVGDYNAMYSPNHKKEQSVVLYKSQNFLHDMDKMEMQSSEYIGGRCS